MRPYNIHKDFRGYAWLKPPLHPLLLPLFNFFLQIIFRFAKPAKGVREARRKIPGYQGEAIGVTIFEPEGIEDNAPCLVYLHGGAFVLKASPHHKRLACAYALETPCKVVFVDYRLAPKYPFPVGLEDCYAVFEWVRANADMLGIDRNRIAIGGDSAGGALSAAVCLMARDSGAPVPCFQMLIYPVTDARQGTESMKEFVDTPLWDARLNARMWRLYLGNGLSGKREYASPAEAESLAQMPETYIEVAEFDCLRDEGINLADVLRKTGVQTESNATAGTVHGYDLIWKSEITRQAVGRRIAALKKAFYPPGR
jgi:acetyl esterase